MNVNVNVMFTFTFTKCSRILGEQCQGFQFLYLCEGMEWEQEQAGGEKLWEWEREWELTVGGMRRGAPLR